jgi:hypothetical protein
LKLTFELIILLQASSQHHHHHAVCDRLGEEEGEEEGDHVIDVYGDGNEANHGSYYWRGKLFLVIECAITMQ